MRPEAKAVIICAASMVLCIVLAACREEWAWESYLGVHMAHDPPLDEWVTPEQVDEMGMSLLEGLEPIGYPLGRAAECMGSVILISHAKPIYYESWGPYNGLQRDMMLHVVATACPWASTFRHEAAHWLQYCVKKGYDPGHEDTAVWAVADAYVPCAEPGS